MKDLIEKLPEFKCRASKAGLLNMGYKSIDDSDLKRIKELENERDTLINANGNKVKWTDNKQIELDKLIHLLNNPELGQSIKTYLKEWLISQLTSKRKDIESKYLTRGLAVEHLAIERIGRYYGVECVKNETQLENEYFTGEFDTLVNVETPIIVDAKSSWDAFTFPYFEEDAPEGYKDQDLVYLDLTGCKKAAVAFCLENGTLEEVERLSWKIAKKEGAEEPDINHWDEAEKRLNYDHLPESMRIKVYEFDINNQRIDEMKKRVIECRAYIKNVLIPLIIKNNK